jgi:hypothetical protein
LSKWWSLPTPGEAKAKAMPGRLYIHTIQAQWKMTEKATNKQNYIFLHYIIATFEKMS